MEVLTKPSDKNSPEEYNRIFHERTNKGANWQDKRRWKELVRYYEGGLILDQGCLDSEICELIPDRSKYIGMDLAQEAIGEMFLRYGSKVAFEVGDLYKTEIKDKILDYVVLGEVLEHLERPADAIKEAFRILKPGGVLAVSVPLEEAREPGAVDGHRHLWSFTKKDLEDLLDPYSYQIKFKVLGSKWFPKYKYCWPQLICWAWKQYT